MRTQKKNIIFNGIILIIMVITAITLICCGLLGFYNMDKTISLLKSIFFIIMGLQLIILTIKFL